MLARIAIRYDTKANWLAADPILAQGEIGCEADTRLLKIGDGTTKWSNLPYSTQSAQLLQSDLTVTVGSGGDYATINAALEDIVARYYPTYKSGGNCPRVTISLLSGFVMSEQLLVESLDLSWITITGDDAETTIDRSALTTMFEGAYPAFGVTDGGFLPIIGQLFNMDASGASSTRDGIKVANNSRAIVRDGCGIKNAGGAGVSVAYGSVLFANGAIFANADSSGVNVSHGSMASVNDVDVSNADNTGVVASRGSVVEAQGANVSGAGSYGIHVYYGAFADASNADASNAGTHGFRVGSGGIIAANGGTGTLNQTANTVTASGIIFQ